VLHTLNVVGRWLAGIAFATWIGIHAVKGQHPTHGWYDTLLYICFALGLLLIALTSTRLQNKLRRGPTLLLTGIEDFQRSANASRSPNDLQVVFAKVRNTRNGGGAAATLADAEVWMEAYDEQNRLVTRCQGNWLRLHAGVAEHEPVKQITLRPTSEEWGLELGGKFLWGADAWLAGETNPSLTPGSYRVTASVSDGVRKAREFEWKLTNPGPEKRLTVPGLAAPTAPSPPVAAARSMTATPEEPTQDEIVRRRFIRSVAQEAIGTLEYQLAYLEDESQFERLREHATGTWSSKKEAVSGEEEFLTAYPATERAFHGIDRAIRGGWNHPDRQRAVNDVRLALDALNQVVKADERI
jgi:hypothetical protein